jgi:hypothetical protein
LRISETIKNYAMLNMRQPCGEIDTKARTHPLKYSNKITKNYCGMKKDEKVRGAMAMFRLSTTVR